MSFTFFVSKKFTLSRKDSRFITLISFISVVGISIGTAILIIALSVLNGFQKIIEEKITDFDAHIQITSFQTLLPNYHQVLPFIYETIEPFAVDVSPYAANLSIISSKNFQEGVSIKGIIPSNKSLRLQKSIIDGEYLTDFSEKPSLLVGKKLAEKLFINVGDLVTVFALNKNEIPTPNNLPNIQRFKVTGIFESGMANYDDQIAYTDLQTAQALFNFDDNVTGYDVKLNDITKIDSLTFLLSKKLGYPHDVRSIYQIHRNIFTWIELQKKPIPIVLGLIILVAVFNIVGSLLMVVLEKTNAIGTLKSLGALNSQISRIFIFQGFFLAAAGVIIGNLLAYTLILIQIKYNIISLPSSVYFTSTVPLIISRDIFFLVSAITLLLSLTAAFIPSFIASRFKPISSLRFN